MRLDEIGFDEVESYIASKLAQDVPLSARSINMTVTLQASILQTAVERDLIPRNVATGKRRRVREHAPRRTYLQSAMQIRTVLQAADELDRQAHAATCHIKRKAMIATLIFAGLRISELLALRRADLDLQAGWLAVQDAKTDAGIRSVKIRPALQHELQAVLASTPGTPASGYVYPTSTGKAFSDDNFRNRVLTNVVATANRNLTQQNLPPLPKGLTPHSLRRTFVSILYALGEDPGTVMDEIGHTNPALALRIYRHAMRQGDNEKTQLRALIENT